MSSKRQLTTGFDRSSTASMVAAGLDLGGKRAVVTGASSGIGLETARALAHAGAQVTLAVRDFAAGQAAAAEIDRGDGHMSVHVAQLDLADRASIAAFVSGWHGPLNVLVNNAGVMASPMTRTTDGWELQFATNHLGHFALALGLHSALRSADGARVVSVSSSGHMMSDIVYEDVHFNERPYDPWLAYGQSKTANILFAVEGARQWADDGIAVNACMPGGIKTGLQRHLSSETLGRHEELAASSPDMAWKTPQQGAATSVLLAVSPMIDGVTGRYFEDVNEAGPRVPDGMHGYAPWVMDAENAARLWEYSKLEISR